MVLMSCERLTLGYGSRCVVENLSFQVRKGDYLCIVGENGTGKSTLIQTCLGLLQPLAGKLVLAEELRPNEIGYLPQQNAIREDFPASCKEVVLSGCLNRCGWRPFYNQQEKQAARENMLRLGVLDLADRCYSELSGGQKQRVLLARALCATKKMLLLDEPVTGLDIRATKEMYNLIQQLNSNGITIMMVTHDVTTAIDKASHVLDLSSKSVFWGSRQEYEYFRSNCFIREGR